jgi:hypothetical protein
MVVVCKKLLLPATTALTSAITGDVPELLPPATSPASCCRSPPQQSAATTGDVPELLPPV